MKKIVLETDCVVCEIDESIPVLRHRWIRKPSKEEFKDGLCSILEEYKKLRDSYKGLKWLADTELLGELDEETEDWLNTDWDRMIFGEAGVTVHAVILGPDLFADYPMEVFKMSAAREFEEKGVKLEVFSNEEKAYDWLRNN